MNSINCHEKEGGTNRYAKRMVNGPIDVCFKKKKKKGKSERNSARIENEENKGKARTRDRNRANYNCYYALERVDIIRLHTGK